MPQINVPTASFRRRLTRTYDAGNSEDDAIAAILQIVCPTGTLVPTLLAAEPGDGWKLCNGQAISKADYPRLYAVIGGAYGETATTFNLPDLAGRFPMGAGAAALLSVGGAALVSLTVDQMPAHTHGVDDPGHGHTFTGDEHTHVLTDPGHTHTAAAVQVNSAGAGAAVGAAVAGNTGTATTGITIAAATATGTVSEETTGVTVASAGSGEPVDITPPYIAVNWMVRT